MRVLMLLSKPLRYDARVAKEARALTDAGHEVRVLQWARHDPEEPAVEKLDGIRLQRLRSGSGDAIRAMPTWWKDATAAAEAMHADWPFDVVHAHDWDTLPIGVRLKRSLGVKLVFDAHEIYHKVVKGDRGTVIAAGVALLERKWLPAVDAVVTCGDAFAEHYRRWDADLALVRNCFAAAPWPYEPTGNHEFTIGYIGTLTRDRFFPDAVHALGDLPGIRFAVGGKQEGVFETVGEAADRYYNVDWLGTLPHETILDATRGHDAVLVYQDRATPQYRIQLVNKLFDAMACGRPVIASAGTAVGAFVERNDVGVVGRYTSGGLREVAASLAEDPAACERMGRNGIALAAETFHWGPQAAALVERYERL